jgi:hypothetical protein
VEHHILLFELVQVLFGSVKEFFLMLGAAFALVVLWRKLRRDSGAEDRIED